MERRKIRLTLPTGRLQAAVIELLAQAGIPVAVSDKNYRPPVGDDRFQVKLLKAANLATLVELGKHDLGFTGLDWVRENCAEVETLLDTGLDPVRIVAAAPRDSDPFAITDRPVVVASEYERLASDFVAERARSWRCVRTHGATEVFPPEDADLVVDNTATGAALRANGLVEIGELLRSSTLLVANRAALADAGLRADIDDLVLLLRSALAARDRVLLEMNVGRDRLDAVVALLPAMKSPTVQPLFAGGGYAVKAAVPKAAVARLIPSLVRAGASDILETTLRRVVS